MPAKTKTAAKSPQLQPENYGYEIVLKRTPKSVQIISGCRKFTFDQAREHWTKRKGAPVCAIGLEDCNCESGSLAGSEERSRALKMLKLLPTLEKRAKSYGWLTATKVKRPRAS